MGLIFSTSHHLNPFVSDVGYNSVGRLLEGLRSEGVRLDVTAKQQIADLDHLALLGKVSLKYKNKLLFYLSCFK